MPTHFVKPKAPTLLSHKEYHEISPTNLLLPMTSPSVYVIPGMLDVERFDVALSKALSRFPLLAGRLVRPDTPDAPWRIRLTNSGVPVSLTNSDADEVIPVDLSAQSSLPLAQPPNVAGIINTEGESNEPLFRVTVTQFPKLNSTSIGVCISHVVSDGFGLMLFIRLLSQLYQGLEPLDPPPYYETQAIKSELPATLLPTRPRYTPTPPPWGPLEFIGIKLTATQLAEIHNSVTKGTKRPGVSKVDVVVGLLARCLSEVEPESKPIDTISYVVNHRGMGLYPLNAILNAIVWVSTTTGPQVSKGVDIRDGILACATEIRKSLARLKNPEFLKETVADLAKRLSRTAWDKGGLADILIVEEGHMCVNNTWRFDGPSAHFGHPEEFRGYLCHAPVPRRVAITPQNLKYVDGKWVSRTGGMDVALYIPLNRRKRFEELFEGYAKSLGMTGSVEFVPHRPAPLRARL